MVLSISETDLVEGKKEGKREQTRLKRGSMRCVSFREKRRRP